jgi:XTP/dITP diphosphohydrolase
VKLIFATRNPGKIEEMRSLLADAKVEVASAEEAGVMEDVVEDGKTFEENALKKARFVAQKTGQWAVADDSGVCIWALGCMPGVRTARWAGEGASDERLVSYTLEQMKDVPEGKRNAWFESAVALVSPDGPAFAGASAGRQEWVFEGKVEGKIATEPRGVARKKLPYDFLFIPDGYEQTFGEMPEALKNRLSHRGRAFAKLKDFLKSL